MPKKTINAKEVLQDIKAGMHKNALMNKYNLSPGQLKSITDKLEAAGLLEPPAPEPPPRTSGHLDPLAFFTCPSCGHSQDGDYDECPRCGVVVSKYEPPKDSAAKQRGDDPAKAKVEFDGWAATNPKSYRMWKILAAVIVIAVAVTAITMFKRYRDKYQIVQPVAAPEVVSPDAADEAAQAAGPPSVKDMIDQRMPRVAPINPEVDAHMRKSVGGIGEALDDRNRARDDLTNKQ